MTFYVAMDLYLTPETLDEARDVFREILVDTRAFDGCLGAVVYEDQAEATHWHVIEGWESEEHDAAYRAFRASPEGTTRLREFISRPPVTVKYTLTGI
jgi:quinol monooxygenase YgiN